MPMTVKKEHNKIWNIRVAISKIHMIYLQLKKQLKWKWTHI